MKRLHLPLLCVFLLLVACKANPLNERTFQGVWNDYLQREFEEGFDERQSISQRENLLRESAAAHGIDYEALKNYMSAKQKDKYDRIFIQR